MLFGGYLQATRQMIQLDSALQIPMGVIYSAVTVIALLLVTYIPEISMTIPNLLGLVK